MCRKKERGRGGLIVFLLLQATALCAEFAGGTGDPNDPYRIATAEQLISIGQDPNLHKKHFVLIEDIDFDPNLPNGRVFTNALIARDRRVNFAWEENMKFQGVLDGQGHIISNLHIEGEEGYVIGLFGRLSGLVKDLHFRDVVISGSPCGALTGYIEDCGFILRCSVTGQLTGDKEVGGLAGSNDNGSLVECEARARVTGGEDIGGMVGGGWGGTLKRCMAEADVGGDMDIGGLVGTAVEGDIIECGSKCVVSGRKNIGGLIGHAQRTVIWWSSAHCEVSAEETAGGLAGNAYWRMGPMFIDCYAQGTIYGSIVGGLCGKSVYNQIINCYAACELIGLEIEGREPVVGGLFGDTPIPDWMHLIVGCFWDSELAGIASNADSDPLDFGLGLTTEQMYDEENFRNAGWDFGHTWVIRDGGYPRLQWEKVDEVEDL